MKTETKPNGEVLLKKLTAERKVHDRVCSILAVTVLLLAGSITYNIWQFIGTSSLEHRLEVIRNIEGNTDATVVSRNLYDDMTSRLRHDVNVGWSMYTDILEKLWECKEKTAGKKPTNWVTWPEGAPVWYVKVTTDDCMDLCTKQTKPIREELSNCKCSCPSNVATPSLWEPNSYVRSH